MLDFLAIGEVMGELRRAPDGAFSVGFAGDTYNTAVYCARALGQGAQVGYMTRVGGDPLSAGLIQTLDAEGISADYVECESDGRLGLYSVSTDNTGERSFTYWREGSAASTMFVGGVPALPEAKVVYLSGISLAILGTAARDNLFGALEDAKRGGATIAFDSNYRPALWKTAEIARATISQAWALADIALPSIDDEMALHGDRDEEAVQERFAKGYARCAIKRGLRGPLSPTLSQADHPPFEPAETVLDTTAAGDSFNGGYLAAWLQGRDEAACLAAGHALAACVVGHPGAIAPR